ncbi:oxidoreductase [Catellatospora sp. TT07R-123]|uniref:oxidoreductase n=1 Tax=Catellatospora sp. TT07R-123 TaxID=2733863 RepID=UPI001B1E08FE|nr:oxidoreductase [Catellatospora sp. TT07R-123]GHJ48260.1 oxidoreductase [Catellatospora sp. TT07R-123]
MTVAGGSLALADDLVLSRMGYGAMQLAGPGVWGPPRDRAEAAAVLREVVAQGVTHLDTSDYYGPYTVNELIHKVLHPYPPQLRIVTKVGARRGPDKSWPPALSRDDLVGAVHDNLRRLGVDALDVVNLRVGGVERPTPGSIAEPFSVLAELREQGLIRHLGVSGVSDEQLTEAQSIAPVVCVQNLYNIVRRDDDALVDRCAREGLAYTPFFPLGGFSPLQSQELDEIAAGLGATARQVALAWLLQRSPTMLLIPGTSSLKHLRENLAAADLALPADAVAALDALT